jgi:DNA (cytosine-5)-methyltransferase 1
MIDVVELFAGVGGFRLGLEGFKKTNSKFYSSLSGYIDEIEYPQYFSTILSNQFEPSTKIQVASSIYTKQFGEIGHFNLDISKLSVQDIVHSQSELGQSDRPLMMVGGFPCQDYSVGTLLKNSKGLKGVKGVLWWEINRLLCELKDIGKAPKYLLFENVDRLLKSPVKSRGSDFATILYCLSKLGYTVEYQSVNAADLGFVQKRSRVFILAYFGKPKGILRDALNISQISSGDIINIPDYKFTKSNIGRIQNRFKGSKTSPFLNGGILHEGSVFPYKAEFAKSYNPMVFEDIRIDESLEDVSSLLVSNKTIKSWKEAKGGKRIQRFKPDGTPYIWAEGAMELDQKNDKPLRTVITSEGGLSPSRTRHLVSLNNPMNGHIYRILHPLEMERANMFPDYFTFGNNISPKKVGFLMGNALVVGIVEKIRNTILELEINKSN